MDTKQLITLAKDHYRKLDLQESAVKRSDIDERVYAVTQLIKIAKEQGRNRPMHPTVFGFVFKSTLLILESRGVKVNNRKSLQGINDSAGFDYIMALIDPENAEHSAAIEIITEQPADASMVVMNRPAPVIDYGLPAGAEDLTMQITQEVNNNGKC